MLGRPDEHDSYQMSLQQHLLFGFCAQRRALFAMTRASLCRVLALSVLAPTSLFTSPLLAAPKALAAGSKSAAELAALPPQPMQAWLQHLGVQSQALADAKGFDSVAATQVANEALRPGVSLPELVARPAQTIGELTAELGPQKSDNEISLPAKTRDEALPAAPAVTLAVVDSSAPTTPTSAITVRVADAPATTTAPSQRGNPRRPSSKATATPVARLEIKSSLAQNARAAASAKTQRLPSREEVLAASLLASKKAQQKQASAAAEQAQASHLHLRLSGDSLQLSPSSLSLVTGQATQVHFEGGPGASLPAVFVRHADILSWQASNQELLAKASGRTEVYFYHGQKLHILPVAVGGSTAAPDRNLLAQLETPLLLTDLTALPMGEAEHKTAAPAYELAATAALQAKPGAAVVGNASTQRGPFETEAQEVGYTKLALRLVDERSALHGKKPVYYPAAGVEVRIAGTSFVGKTGANGVLDGLSAPTDSRLLLTVNDPTGTYRPSVLELSTGRQTDSGVTTLKVLRGAVEESLLEVANLERDPEAASLCADVIGADLQPQAGVRLEIDWQDVTTLYFNEYGLPDRQQGATGPSGRVCLFNVPAGAASLTLFADKQLLGIIPVVLFAGRHTELSLNPAEQARLATYIGSMATAHEQRNLSEDETAQYRPLDLVDLLPYGAGDPFTQEDLGFLHSADPLAVSQGRGFYLVDSPDFEPTLYTYEAKRHKRRGHVTPLIPRGFIEDMAFYSGIVQDPALGSVVVEHGALQGQGKASELQVHLLDHQGHDVGEGVYFGVAPVRKAVYFNVPDGLYTVFVETTDGNWVRVDTVMVYQGTTSYLRTGSPVLGQARKPS